MSSSVPGLDAVLSPLAALCEVGSACELQGWQCDVWTLSPEAVEQLVKAYNTMLAPESIDPDIVAALAADGIDLGDLLYHDTAADDTITRSDMTELAAAASLVATDGLSCDFIHLANFPKGERHVSAPGADIVGARLTLAANVVLAPDEQVLVCSVKHSVSDAGNLRYKLTTSLDDPPLTVAYISAQLRLLNHKLVAGGVQDGRVFLALRAEERAHLILVGFAAVDATLADALEGQLNNLPSRSGNRRLRRLVIPTLSVLHTRVQ